MRLAAPLAALALALAAAPAAVAAAPDQVGEWGPLMSFRAPATHQALLRDGRVLYWRNGDEAFVWDPVADPAGVRVKAVPAPFPIPPVNLHCAAQVVLADGRVMAIGGQVDGPHAAITAAAVFDPATEKWTQVADMHYPRWYPTATVLADGRVAVFGGEAADGNREPHLEVYDPRADTWTVIAGADRPEDLYSANFLLPDGRIFNATPSKFTGGVATALLDLGTGKWTAGPPATWRTIGYSESFAMYRPGKIIRTGGSPTTMASTSTATSQGEPIDMMSTSPSWQLTSMAFPRRRHNLVVLADGTVLVVGGTQQGDDPAQAVLAAEIWDPDTRAWATVAAAGLPRMYHSAALLLPDGRVLVGGGEPSTAGLANSRSAEVYSPPYLFKGPRPRIAGAPSRVGYAAPFQVATPDAADIASVVLIRPSAVTHANNMEQRYVPLQFARRAGGLDVTAPANGNWAPPGWYMLVIKTAAGVPSVAAWVQLGGGGVLDPPVLPPVIPGEPQPQPQPPGGPNPGGRTNPVPPSPSPVAGRGDTPRGTTVTVPSRIALRTMRTRGLAVRLQIDRPLTSMHRALRVRVLRAAGRRRRVVTTLFRVPPRQGSYRLVLRSRALRRLRPGRYVLEVAIGNSRHALWASVRKTFVVIR